jgi:putative phage-type endonuclease
MDGWHLLMIGITGPLFCGHLSIETSLTDWLDVEQGSDEWKAARLGKVTASRVADVVAKTKTGWGASRANYMAELLVERLTGVPADAYTNTAMQWGTITEPEARMEYQLSTGCEVQQVGFVPHPTITMAGCSPDGLIVGDAWDAGLVGESAERAARVIDAGLVEIKCPNSATHIETLLGRPPRVPDKYEKQIQFQLACTGRQWCDFVSYDPRLPEPMRLFIRRIERDHRQIAFLEECVEEFLAELAEKIIELNALYGANVERKVV